MILAFVGAGVALPPWPQGGAGGFGADTELALVAEAADSMQPAFAPKPETVLVAPAAPKAASTPASREEATIARFLASKYELTVEHMQEIVSIAYRTGREVKIDPLLILAVAGVESRFDTDAQSSRGAKGLMQVHARVHADKFAPFGGVSAAFDPLANMKVGARILKDYLHRVGTVEGALKAYVGAADLSDDNGYGAKVLSERDRLLAAVGKEPR